MPNSAAAYILKRWVPWCGGACGVSYDDDDDDVCLTQVARRCSGMIAALVAAGS